MAERPPELLPNAVKEGNNMGPRCAHEQEVNISGVIREREY